MYVCTCIYTCIEIYTCVYTYKRQPKKYIWIRLKKGNPYSLVYSHN